MKIQKVIILILGCIVLACGYYAYTNITYDYDSSPFAYSNAEEQNKYEGFHNQFRHFPQENAIIFHKKAGFTTLETFEKVQAFQDELYNLDGVVKITSLQTLQVPQKSPFGVIYPEILLLNDSSFEPSFERLELYPDIRNKFLSENNEYLCFYVLDDSSNANFAQNLDQTLSEQTFIDKYYVLGANIQNDEAQKAIVNESLWIGITASLILVTLFFIFIPSVYRLLIVLLLTIVNGAICFINMYLFDIPVTVLTAIVPGIIAILSFTDQMHISYHYNILRRENVDSIELNKALFRKIGLPLILTSLANIIGFLVFFANGGITRINELALVSTLGILISYFISRFALPILLSKEVPVFRNEIRSTQFLNSTLNFAIKNSKSSLAIFTIITVLIGLGIYQYSKIDMYYYSHEENRLKYEEASAVYDEHFQGIRDIEVIIENKNGVFNEETISLIDTIENHLLEKYGCKTIFSLNTILKRYERYLNNGNPSAYTLPKKLDTQYITDVNKFRSELAIDALVNEEETCVRIIGSLPDIGTNEGRIRNQGLEDFIATLKSDAYEISLGGKALLFDKGIYSLSSTVILLLFIGMGIIGLFIGFFYKKILLGLAAIWVNLLPIGFALSMMALLEVDINPSSLFMLTILIGVALDDSIYLLGTLKEIEKSTEQMGITHYLSQNTYPLFVTSIVISFSFCALLISSNYISFNFGIIMATSLIFAFLTDMLLLPVIINKLYAKK